MEKTVVKTDIQKAIAELRPYLPPRFTDVLAKENEVTPQYVRLVWKGDRQNPKILTDTLAALEAAKIAKSELDKKLSAV